MDMLAYTTCDDIRALLGVEDDEITDDTLVLELYSRSLSSELDDINVQLTPKYLEIKAIDPASRTDLQQRFFDTAGLFATYAVARQVCTSLPMFAPKETSDSKTLVGRFSDSPYKETIKAVKSNFDIYRTRLIAAYNAVATTSINTPDRVFMAVSQPSTDPVVG